MEAAELRREFPVMERVAYLNAGTNGPVPSAGIRAAEERMRAELEQGRAGAAYFSELTETGDALRARLAALLGCEPGEVALTRSTTEGVNVALTALDLGPGDEVLTTTEEHPGLLAPLAASARRVGIEVRVVPFEAIAAAVSERTRLVACSHVSWITGAVVDSEALAAAGAPVLLDGAQGLGAVPVDVRDLGCDFYAASGQKWLCGPSGTGCLFVRGDRATALTPAFAGYETLADPERPADLPLHDDARRFDRGPGSGPLWAWWLASIDLLERADLTGLQHRAAELAERLAARLAGRGLRVAPRGRSTLVAWGDTDAAGRAERLAARGIVVRNLPGGDHLRASVGGWSTEEEIERLAAAAAP